MILPSKIIKIFPIIQKEDNGYHFIISKKILLEVRKVKSINSKLKFICQRIT